jgi:type II secretory ATPase GspE/PulE/Tfp pilus assembly ATPase PilB-like protein
MGVEPFLVSSSLLSVLAQRLVRRLCPKCKGPYEPSDVELREAGLDRRRIAGHTVYRGVGCPACLSTGYKGRSGIYELLIVTDGVRQLVMSGASAGVIRKRAIEEGMATLRDDGIRQVLAGNTSLDEVMRVTQEDTVETD